MKIAGQKAIKFATGASNWDYYFNFPWSDCPKAAYFWAVAEPESGAGTSHYGDIRHVKHMMDLGYFDGKLTKAGEKLLAADGHKDYYMQGLVFGVDTLPEEVTR